MKLKNIDGQYYVQEGKQLKPVSIEQAIDLLLKEVQREAEVVHYTLHGEGD